MPAARIRPPEGEPAAWQPALAQVGVKICPWICAKVKAVAPAAGGAAGSVGDRTRPPQAADARQARTRNGTIRLTSIAGNGRRSRGTDPHRALHGAAGLMRFAVIVDRRVAGGKGFLEHDVGGG